MRPYLNLLTCLNFLTPPQIHPTQRFPNRPTCVQKAAQVSFRAIWGSTSYMMLPKDRPATDLPILPPAKNPLGGRAMALLDGFRPLARAGGSPSLRYEWFQILWAFSAYDPRSIPVKTTSTPNTATHRSVMRHPKCRRTRDRAPFY